jgi:hypothetical protein
MRSIFVVVGKVFTEQPFQMPFIERDDVIQQFSAAATHPTLRDAILPGTCERSPDRTHIQPIGLDGAEDEP